MKYFVWGAILFVTAAVVGAFFVIGSPAHERLIRFDKRRVGDLQVIQSQIVSYFASKGELPASLEAMAGFQDFTVPSDPRSGAPYSYAVEDKTHFRLCADFALSSQDAEPSNAAIYGPEPSDNWDHPAGRGCFELKVEEGTNRDWIPPVTVRPAD